MDVSHKNKVTSSLSTSTAIQCIMSECIFRIL